MTTCSDDAAQIGNITLFLGVETAHWHDADFLQACAFCKAHGVTTLLVKVSEIGSSAGDVWYGGFENVDRIRDMIEKQGIHFMPYTFPVNPYIDLHANIGKATAVAKECMNRYGWVCLDVEGEPWQGQAGIDAARAMSNVLQAAPGKVWLSCPADPAINNMLGMMKAFSPCVNVWAPMIYTDGLVQPWINDVVNINPQACVQPTVEMDAQFGTDHVAQIEQTFKDRGILAFSIWYYGQAINEPKLLDQLVSIMKGDTPKPVSTVQLNSNGNVCDCWYWYQLETEQRPDVPNSPIGKYESEDLCGPAATAVLALAGFPGKGALPWTNSQGKKLSDGEAVDQLTDDMSDIEWGTHDGPLGSMVSDMHNFLVRCKLHFWDINPGINAIRAAIQAGYPVLVTAEEGNIIQENTGKQAYGWDVGNHIIALTGVNKNGNFNSPDTLNNAAHGWPPTYIADRLQPSWACVVRLPFLKPIPSGNPLDSNWAHFNAQDTGVKPVPTKAVTKQANDVWATSKQPTDTVTFKAWLSLYPTLNLGSPKGAEFDTVDWGENPVRAQEFNGYHTEVHPEDNIVRVYDSKNQIVVEVEPTK